MDGYGWIWMGMHGQFGSSGTETHAFTLTRVNFFKHLRHVLQEVYEMIADFRIRCQLLAAGDISDKPTVELVCRCFKLEGITLGVFEDLCEFAGCCVLCVGAVAGASMHVSLPSRPSQPCDHRLDFSGIFWKFRRSKTGVAFAK